MLTDEFVRITFVLLAGPYNNRSVWLGVLSEHWRFYHNSSLLLADLLEISVGCTDDGLRAAVVIGSLLLIQ